MGLKSPLDLMFRYYLFAPKHASPANKTPTPPQTAPAFLSLSLSHCASAAGIAAGERCSADAPSPSIADPFCWGCWLGRGGKSRTPDGRAGGDRAVAGNNPRSGLKSLLVPGQPPSGPPGAAQERGGAPGKINTHVDGFKVFSFFYRLCGS